MTEEAKFTYLAEDSRCLKCGGFVFDTFADDRMGAQAGIFLQCAICGAFYENDEHGLI